LLTSYGFDGDNHADHPGFCNRRSCGGRKMIKAIDELMAAVDSYIPLPPRPVISPS